MSDPADHDTGHGQLWQAFLQCCGAKLVRDAASRIGPMLAVGVAGMTQRAT